MVEDSTRTKEEIVEISLKDAVEKAIDECIREGILAEFLSKEKAEAIMFSVFEHNEEEEWRKFREAEREYGIELGIERGREESCKLFLHNLMENQGMTEEEARRALGIV